MHVTSCNPSAWTDVQVHEKALSISLVRSDTDNGAFSGYRVQVEFASLEHSHHSSFEDHGFPSMFFME
jgi:hypothetical protein